MSRFKHDYTFAAHVVKALGGVDALGEVKAQVEGLEFPCCPFCGGEAVVGLGSAYGQPTVVVECSRCHASTVRTGPSFNYVTGTMTTMHDAINSAARRWSRREGGAA